MEPMKQLLTILLLTVLPMLSSATATNLLISGSTDGTIKVWDIDTAANVLNISAGSGVVSSALVPDQSLFATGTVAPVVRIWNYTSGENVRNLTGDRASVVGSLAFSPDSKFLFVGHGAGLAILVVFNFTNGSVVRTHHTTRTDGIYAVAVSNDNQYYFHANDTDNLVTQRSINTGAIVQTLNTGVNIPQMNSMATSTSGIFFVGGTGDYSIRALSISTGLLVGTMTGHTDSVNAILLSADESTLYSVSDDHTLKVWRTSNYTNVTSIDVGAQAFSIALTGAPDSVYVGDVNGLIHRYNVVSRVETQTLRQSGFIYALAYVRPALAPPTTTATTGSTTESTGTTPATGPTTTAATGATTTAATGPTTSTGPTTGATGTTTAATQTNTTAPSSGVVSPGVVTLIVISVVIFFVSSH